MLTIYKYQILSKNGKYHSIQLPIGAKILKSDFQQDDLFVWALVDTEAKMEMRYIIIFPTGVDMSQYNESTLLFIDTVFIEDLVFHVFEYNVN